jgi:hypothetical protein
MSEINIYTYEIYLLDYFEGKLSQKMAEKLRQFVLKHPELDIELDSNPCGVHLSEEKIVFVHKGSLLRDERADEFADLVIAEMEGLASDEELRLKNELLVRFPYLKNEEKYVLQTVVKPNIWVEFPRKKALVKKSGLGKRIVLYWSGAAASIIVISLAVVLNRKPKTESAQLASTRIEQVKSDFSIHPLNEGGNSSENNRVLAVNDVPKRELATKNILDKHTANFTVDSLQQQVLSAFSISAPSLQLPVHKSDTQIASQNPGMAMTDQSLDLLSPQAFLEKLFHTSDSLKNEKKGFTLRIGKLVLLHFESRNKK